MLAAFTLLAVLTCSHARAFASESEVDLATRVSPELMQRPIDKETGIGTVHQTVSTTNGEAQAFYDQGLAEIHSYRWTCAAQSFNQALRLDPKLAMAEAGLARVYLQLHQPEEAKKHAEQARSLASSATPRERAWIDAQVLQIDAALADKDDAPAKIAAYKSSLDALLALDPTDPEAQVLRGLAEEPSGYGRGQGGGAATLPYYNAALEKAPKHIGANHYIAHSFENLGRYQEASTHALAYANEAPQAAHAQHMAGHALGRLGQWNGATERFEAADQIEKKDDDSGAVPHAQDWHHVHNLMLLGLSLAEEGRAEDAKRTLAAGFAAPNPSPTMEIWYAIYPEYLMATGDQNGALAAARELSARPSPILRPVGAALEGEALVFLGKTPEAREAHDRAVASLDDLRSKLAGEPMSDDLPEVIDEFIIVLEERMALRGGSASDANVLEMAKQIASVESFDGWARMHLRLPRLEADALAANKPTLAAQIAALRATARNPGAAKTPSPGSAAAGAAAAGFASSRPGPRVPGASPATGPVAAMAESWNDDGIHWMTFEDGLAEAGKSGKPICLVFYTDWCPHCRNYSHVFSDPKVASLAKSFVMVRVNRDQDPALSKRFAVDGDYIPRTYFLSPRGEVAPDIHSDRPTYLYFYNENDPAGVLAGMQSAVERFGKAGKDATASEDRT